MHMESAYGFMLVWYILRISKQTCFFDIGFMVKFLYAAFLKHPFPLADWFDCSHCACGLYIGNEEVSEGIVFLMYKLFGRYDFKKKAPGSQFCFDDGVQFDQNQLEFVQIKASEAEIGRLINICNACCNQTRGYNRYDKVLSMFSSVFSPLEDNVDIYNAPSLHNAQALLLILRAGLDAENNKSLLERLKELNSREVYSAQLYKTMILTGGAIVTMT